VRGVSVTDAAQQFSFWRFHPFWTTGVPVQEGARVRVARARPDPARSFGA
jgi:hypothetical protein